MENKYQAKVLEIPWELWNLIFSSSLPHTFYRTAIPLVSKTFNNIFHFFFPSLKINLGVFSLLLRLPFPNYQQPKNVGLNAS